jgi:hypothetical protein
MTGSSEAIQSPAKDLDCVVALLLAMTRKKGKQQ